MQRVLFSPTGFRKTIHERRGIRIFKDDIYVRPALISLSFIGLYPQLKRGKNIKEITLKKFYNDNMNIFSGYVLLFTGIRQNIHFGTDNVTGVQLVYSFSLRESFLLLDHRSKCRCKGGAHL